MPIRVILRRLLLLAAIEIGFPSGIGKNIEFFVAYVVGKEVDPECSHS